MVIGSGFAELDPVLYMLPETLQRGANHGCLELYALLCGYYPGTEMKRSSDNFHDGRTRLSAWRPRRTRVSPYRGQPA